MRLNIKTITKKLPAVTAITFLLWNKTVVFRKHQYFLVIHDELVIKRESIQTFPDRLLKTEGYID